MLKELGVKKGDRVTIYLPMIPEAAYAMLACARIGAVHSVVFGGFSPDSLADRIVDCDEQIVITADEGLRGGKPVPLKANADEALKKCPGVKKVLVVKHAPAARSPGTPAATCGGTRSPPRSPPTARPSRWTPRTRCSSSTPRARPASPRACCTPPAATSSSPR